MMFLLTINCNQCFRFMYIIKYLVCVSSAYLIGSSVCKVGYFIHSRASFCQRIMNILLFIFHPHTVLELIILMFKVHLSNTMHNFFFSYILHFSCEQGSIKNRRLSLRGRNASYLAVNVKYVL